MIYTTGSANKNIDDLKPKLSRLDAQLIDVRFNPPEMPLKWSKTYLQLLLRRRYRHLPSLGAREISPGKFAIQNLTLGLRLLGEENCNVVLMCDCAVLENCHRQVIVQELIKLGKESHEIDSWDL